ncbi:hypothetical protein ACIQXQ_10600 [Peribacillus sp. NPDC097198]
MQVDVINFNLSAIGVTKKPNMQQTEYKGTSSEHAIKGYRPVSHGQKGTLVETPVYDGDILVHGNQVIGPAIIEQKVTTIVVLSGYNVLLDKNDNYIMYRKEMDEKLLQPFIEEKRGVAIE